ncbi:peptide-methionine (S)-S-oxide reductase MsrA [Salinibius halmophilus]|uniref:peptide-methionine (S)-S-oxide reductase MsrA n=1 Tax=Salinibius halmophilus TaxID=1853216 RepID=UPI000E66C1C0|nr:peptide-methionine (S)-S-oxide reductase MsrA [Salinibius halmophilus]
MKTTSLPSPEEALAGRREPLAVVNQHYVKNTSIKPPFGEGIRTIQFGMGCFWGAERLFWNLDGVVSTAVGYAGGYTPNPTYEEVCSGQTGHTEAVLIAYDPKQISLAKLLEVFFNEHDPTQGMRQWNDIGTQYRSAIYCSADDLNCVEAAIDAARDQFHKQGKGDITTEVKSEQTFYYAETYHQQYLAKNPNGYCGLKGAGVVCHLT